MIASMLNFVGFYIVTIFLFGLWKSNLQLSDLENTLKKLPLFLKLLLSLHLILYFLNQSLGILKGSYLDIFHFLFTKPSFFIHEAGHVYFKLFGMFMGVIGGTLCELSAPLILIIFSLRRGYFLTLSVSLYWLGQILIGVARYIESAPSNKLHPDLYGIHDWHYLLSSVQALPYAKSFSVLVNLFGLTILFAGAIFFLTNTILPKLPRAADRSRSSDSSKTRFTASPLLRHYFRRHLLRFFISPGKGNELFDLTMVILTQVAAVDGRISAKEISGIERFAKYELGLSPERLVILLQQLRGMRRASGDYRDSFRELYLSVNGNKILIEAIFDVVIAMAHADGAFSQDEKELWQEAGRICKLSESDLRRLLARHHLRSAFSQGPSKSRLDRKRFRQSSRSSNQDSGRGRSTYTHEQSSSTQHCFQILGVSENDSLSDIKKKYRELVKQTHPDAVLQMGAPEEFRKTAEARFREIQEAYEQVCRIKK